MKTNRDVVQSLSTHKLANLFVFRQYRTEFDYNYDDELEECGESEYFVSTLIPGEWSDICDAIAAVEKYLDAEMDDDWEYELASQQRDKERDVS